MQQEAYAGIVPPRHGGPLPDSYLLLKKKQKGAFRLKHGWIERAKKIKLLRDRYFFTEKPSRERTVSLSSITVRGTLSVPLIASFYSDTPQPPFDISELQQSLFSGPSSTGTVSDYYREVSYSKFDVSGSVYGWVALANDEVYYTGGIYQGVQPGISKTGELIKECLDAMDPSVDFGQFDNDGPDGVANSGDDDGFVDILIISHSTAGAECGGSSYHMWSHSWVYSEWPVSGGSPYETNDPSQSGGYIKVNDYMIVPSLSCEEGMIEIGVICHELGHSLGLPDLYDNYGGFGIGNWGLMGIGNWNTPSSPAHMCAWSKEQLGWLEPSVVDWRKKKIELKPSEENPEAVKIALPTRRFRRLKYASFEGAYGMVCGYTDNEADVRGMPGGAGYGNDWNESISHDFTIDYRRPVVISFEVLYDMEPDYDFGYLLINTGGSEDTVARYTGAGSKKETIALDDYLPSGRTSFTLKFAFESDYNVSDEDGGYDSHPGVAFTIDNVSLTGGGLDYFCDFERDPGGWRCTSPPAEYFLVENRRRLGFDSHLPGQGLLIWHAENSIAYSYLGNTGGYTNTQARGLVLEEADGRYNLLLPEDLGGNKGDSGDPYPGTTNKRLFSQNTVPSSQSNSGYPTPVVISNISYNLSESSAIFKGGFPPPEIFDVSPDSLNTELYTEAYLDVLGKNIQYGANCYLVNGSDTVMAMDTEWLGEERVIAHLSLESLYAGDWGLLLKSGDGQLAYLADAVTVVSLYKMVSVQEGINYISLKWELVGTDSVRGCVVYRGPYRGVFSELSDTLRSDSGVYGYSDSTVVPGIDYSFKIVTFLDSGESRQIVLWGPYSIVASPFVAFQNYPNPFSSSTTLSFFVPATMDMSIKVYDILGRVVDDLGISSYKRGVHEVEWFPHGIASGVYFCVFSSSRRTIVKKVVYIK